MSVRPSAGILVFRRVPLGLEVLLAHLGGPFWARRDAGAWTIPKGELEPDESALVAAYREFEEELGLPVPAGPAIPLGEIVQRGGKRVTAWAVEGDLDPARMEPGLFEMEWPRGSGRLQAFPEVDRAAWFGIEEAGSRILEAQREFLARLPQRLRDGAANPPWHG